MPMEDRENPAIGALALMVMQYLEEHPDGLVDSLAMSAGEHAIAALSELGFMETVVSGRVFGRWTDAGRALCEKVCD
ncbi:hypothetical protein GVN24_14455 [Rhizobium sp. CRIBSB]|nr:hypothetical protein [Rhizobium sp. CRIBSB]